MARHSAAPFSAATPLHYGHSFPRRWTRLPVRITPYPIVEYGRKDAQDFGGLTSKDFPSSRGSRSVASSRAGRTRWQSTRVAGV